MNIDNLTKLADFLDTVPQIKFSMETFARDEHGEALFSPQVHECATVACACGSGPAAGIPVAPSDQSWADYGERAFNLNFGDLDWVWCFGGHWSLVDDSPAGAAKRIRYLIENGSPPLDAIAQMTGVAPYIFGTVH